jgi:hypothetical protein
VGVVLWMDPLPLVPLAGRTSRVKGGQRAVYRVGAAVSGAVAAGIRV